MFGTPEILPNSQIFKVDVIVPFNWNEFSPLKPKYPIVSVLYPTENLDTFATIVKPECSTYTTESFVQPAAYTTTVDPTTVDAYLQTAITNNQLTWDKSNPIGDALSKYFGYTAPVTATSLVQNISYDGTNLIFTIVKDLVEIANNCANSGAQFSEQLNGRQYVVPISYIEHTTNNLFVQSTKYFNIVITNTGEISIGTSSTYHQSARPITVTYPQASCAENEAVRQITYQLKVYDVFDETKVVGPRSLEG